MLCMLCYVISRMAQELFLTVLSSIQPGRVDFKISILVCGLLAGTAHVYLADECTLVTASGGPVSES